MRMRSETTGLSRWPWVIGGTAALVIGGVVLYGQAAPTNTPAPASSSSVTPAPEASGAASGAGDDDPGVAPTGCLGGLDRNSTMFLSAQKEAPHTTYGAVEVATAFYRFIWQTPFPQPGELASVSDSIISSSAASSSFKDLAGSYASVPDITGGVVPRGSQFHLSTTNWLWAFSPDSTSDNVVVHIATGYVIDGALSPTKVAGIGFQMTWSDGAWHVVAGALLDQTLITSGGVRFTGGC